MDLDKISDSWSEDMDSCFDGLSPINSVTVMEEEFQHNMDYMSRSNNCKLTPRRSVGRPEAENRNGPVRNPPLSESSTGGGAGGGSSKRKRPDESGKSNTKKGRREPSEAKPGKEESIEELLKRKETAADVAKVLKDRVDRRQKNDQMEDLKSVLFFAQMYPPMMKFFIPFNLEEWPVRVDLRNIAMEIAKIKEEAVKLKRQGKSTRDVKEELKQRLIDVEQKIKESDYERLKDNEKVDELQESFLAAADNDDQQHVTKFLKQKFFEAFPWLFNGETATNGPNDDQGEGSWQTPDPERKNTVMDMVEEFEKKLLSDNKREVLFSDFQGLQQAIFKAPRGEIPNYLQDIAKKIANACGIPERDNMLILLSAAVYEMEQQKLEQLDWNRLSTWGATCKMAADASFQVKFVEKHLKKILYAYLGLEFKNGGDCEERVRQLQPELEAMKQCMSAEESFGGKHLSDGLFS